MWKILLTGGLLALASILDPMGAWSAGAAETLLLAIQFGGRYLVHCVEDTDHNRGDVMGGSVALVYKGNPNLHAVAAIHYGYRPYGRLGGGITISERGVTTISRDRPGTNTYGASLGCRLMEDRVGARTRTRRRDRPDALTRPQSFIDPVHSISQSFTGTP